MIHEAVSLFAQSVQINACRVVNTPNIIFLCGGPTDTDPAPLLSARDYFWRHLQQNHPEIFKRVKLAETINNWLVGDVFSDLLELEEHLADISDLIILFVESPGSIAELGVFAASSVLEPKTLAIVNNYHPIGGSFIADGPIRRLHVKNESRVLYYQWNSDNLEDIATLEDFKECSSDLSKRLIHRKRDATTESIITKTHGHRMLLAADLVNIIGIVTQEDISACLAQWNYNCDTKQLKQDLSLLQNLHIINRIRYSSQQYFVSRTSAPFIRYDFVPGTAVRDRARIMIDARESIKHRNDSRAKALKSYLRKHSEVAPSV